MSIGLDSWKRNFRSSDWGAQSQEEVRAVLAHMGHRVNLDHHALGPIVSRAKEGDLLEQLEYAFNVLNTIEHGRINAINELASALRGLNSRCDMHVNWQSESKGDLYSLTIESPEGCWDHGCFGSDFVFTAVIRVTYDSACGRLRLWPDSEMPAQLTIWPLDQRDERLTYYGGALAFYVADQWLARLGRDAVRNLL